jgi:hypothetical protein
MYDLAGTPLDPSKGVIEEGFTATGVCASSWHSQLTDFNTRFNNLNTQSTTVTGAALSDLKDKYKTLHNNISQTLKCSNQENDLTGMLTQTGNLQTQIKLREKRKKELQVEVDTALARDEVLRSKDTNLTTHQLFLLDRPVRKGMLPYLWTLSIIFIGIGLILYKTYLPSIEPSVSTIVGVEMSIIDMLFNRPVLITLLVCCVIVMLFLSLKVGGVI